MSTFERAGGLLLSAYDEQASDSHWLALDEDAWINHQSIAGSALAYPLAALSLADRRQLHERLVASLSLEIEMETEIEIEIAIR